MITSSSVSLAETIKVLVVDTGVDLSHRSIRDHVSVLDWTSKDYIDVRGHGTHIAGLVLKDTCKEVELISCRYYSPGSNSLLASIDCFKRALHTNVYVINYSSSGFAFSIDEYKVLKAVSDIGTKIVVSAGNDNIDLTSEVDVYPAKYQDIENLVVVGNSTDKSSNYGLSGMVWENGTNIFSTFPNNRFGKMTGTSQSTAIYTNKLLKKKCLEVR